MPIQGRALSVLVHADTKVGKSTLGNTSPAPRLLLDAEAAYRFLPGRKVFWNPMAEPPPVYDGTWDTCVVIVREYSVLVSAMAWLEVGQHTFESVVIDSISEIQKKMKDQLTSGSGDMDQRLWGKILNDMEALIRKLRDLTEHPTRPLTAVVLTAMTEQRDGKWRPYVQGSLRVTLPYFIDVVGYMWVQDIPPTDPSQPSPGKMRRMLTQPNPLYEAGERVQGRLPEVIDGDGVNIERMLEMVFGPLPVIGNTAPPSATAQVEPAPV